MLGYEFVMAIQCCPLTDFNFYDQWHDIPVSNVTTLVSTARSRLPEKMLDTVNK